MNNAFERDVNVRININGSAFMVNILFESSIHRKFDRIPFMNLSAGVFPIDDFVNVFASMRVIQKKSSRLANYIH